MTFTVTRQRAQEVHDLAIARAGLPYAYGGAFTRDPKRSTDCSGLVFATGAWYGGRTDWPGNRYGSTESFRLDYKIVYDLGFKRLPKGGIAELGFTPVMLVGLQHGGGGMYSHTACTLMTMERPGGPVVVAKRGVDWESQGNGVFLYDGARAWNDPLFHDFWYLDAVLEGGSPVNKPEPKPEESVADDRYESWSIYKKPGEGAIHRLSDFVRAIDAREHERLIAETALEGDLEAIDDLFRVASGNGEYKSAKAVNRAKAALVRLELQNKSALDAYLKAKGV